MILSRIPKIQLNTLVTLALLIAIAYLAVFSRMSTINTPTALDYDPWWFYRYAKMILENNMRMPAWDIQSFSQPGRPANPFNGWSYTIVFFYKILNTFSNIDLMKAAILSPLIMVALITIPAFLLGKLLTNNLGGLATALFAVLAPAFIGVSMAGYCDSDAPVVFYYFLSVFATLLAVKNPKKLTMAFAIIANLLFIWNWGGGWITLIIFTVFTFALPIFRVFENFVHTFIFKINIKSLYEEMVNVCKPIFLISAITNILSFLLLRITLFSSFFGGIAFTGLGLLIRGIILVVLLAWNGSFAYHFFNSVRKETNSKIKLYNLAFLSISIVLFYFIFLASVTVGTIPLLVNISVAELQPINIFNVEGFMSVASRVGLLPTILSFGIFGLAIYKIWKKEKIAIEEIFFFIWLLSMFLLISRGVRFSLQFSIAAAVAGGYIIANYKKYQVPVLIIMLVSLLLLQRIYLQSSFELLGTIFIFGISTLIIYKKDFRMAEFLTLGIFAFQLLFFVSDSLRLGQVSGMEISQNWYDALDWIVANSNTSTMVSTWWDPGHILAGYTYYKNKPIQVMADGAHCDQASCVIYDHDVRIQDMGRGFATSDEEEAVNILKKYTQLSPEQCEKVKSIFGNIIYDNVMRIDPCQPIEKMYVIASADLIGKYYWLSYFGTGTGRNFFQIPFTKQISNSLLYGDGIISLLVNNTNLVPVMNIPEQGIRNRIVQKIIYMQLDGQVITHEYSDRANLVPGTVWAIPTFGVLGTAEQIILPYYVVYMPPEVENSIFTRMYFYNGQGLEHFKLVYQNPEVKIFEVIF